MFYYDISYNTDAAGNLYNRSPAFRPYWPCIKKNENKFFLVAMKQGDTIKLTKSFQHIFSLLGGP